MNFRVAVGKRHAARAVVIARRHVHQAKAAGTPRIEPGHVHDEKAVVDAVFAFVGDHPNAGRSRILHVGTLAHHLVLILSVPCGVRIEPTVHRNATHARIKPAAVLRHAFVRRAAPDGQCLVVGPEKAVHQVDAIRVVRHGTRVVEPADHPGPLGIDFVEVVRRNFVGVVVGVQNPRQAQLVQIVEALNALGFGFRFRERGQQQRRQNRDDGDDHQKLDEREAHATQSRT